MNKKTVSIDFTKEGRMTAVSALFDEYGKMEIKDICSLVIKNPDRKTTRSQWKQMNRWLRLCRKTISDKYSDILNKSMIDAMCYGTGKILIDECSIRHIPCEN